MDFKTGQALLDKFCFAGNGVWTQPPGGGRFA
jgi:hypothetical protein